jgi:hypothetical protein
VGDSRNSNTYVRNMNRNTYRRVVTRWVSVSKRFKVIDHGRIIAGLRGQTTLLTLD